MPGLTVPLPKRFPAAGSLDSVGQMSDACHVDAAAL